MGAAALLRAGRSHRQLPLSNVKDRGARHPLSEGCRAPSHISYGGESGYSQRAFILGLAALSAYRRSTPTSTESRVKPFVALTQCTLPVFTDLQV